MKIFSIMAIGFGLIIVIMLIKYKPVYEVKISNNTLGYIRNKSEFKENLEDNLKNINGEGTDFVTLNIEPEYELKLVNRDKKTNEEEILIALNENSTVTYKYFAVKLNQEVKTCVSTLEQAEQVVDDIKIEYNNNPELDLQVSEEYTQNKTDFKLETLEVAETNLEDEAEIIMDSKYVKINGVRIASMPINKETSMYISSRYGEVSSIRTSAHKGIDLACKLGSDIKTVADGVVKEILVDKAYGNLIKVDHGNGVETWYAHCSKIYATQGQTVKAGDVIAAVGSTGNSTGPHLHLEIRINGRAINPQIYIYK